MATNIITSFFSGFFIPGLDIISTLFTLGYLGWLISREFRGSWTDSHDDLTFAKRSLLNQRVS